MSRFSPARRALLFSLPVATVLAAGLQAPLHAAPVPAPPPGNGTVERARRAPGEAARGTVLRGTIARVYSARSLDVRSDDNRVYRVNLPFPIGFQSGTQVRMRGVLNGSTFDARLITVGDFDRDAADDNENYGNGSYNGGSYGGSYGGGYGGDNYPDSGSGTAERRVILTGQVTRLYGRNEIEVRDDDDGQLYRVRSDAPLDSIRQGDRIEARGALNGTSIRADSVRALGAANGAANSTANGAPNAPIVDFPGSVQSLDLGAGEARVVGDNGRVYIIHSRDSALDALRPGQRVRVRGTYFNGRVEADTVSRIY